MKCGCGTCTSEAWLGVAGPVFDNACTKLLYLDHVTYIQDIRFTHCKRTQHHIANTVWWRMRKDL